MVNFLLNRTVEFKNRERILSTPAEFKGKKNISLQNSEFRLVSILQLLPSYRASPSHIQRNRSCSSGIQISEQGLFAQRLIIVAKIKLYIKRKYSLMMIRTCWHHWSHINK